MIDSGRPSGVWCTWVLGCVVVLVTAMLGFASPASAKKVYIPGISFGSEGSGNGQFKEPVGVAVNDSAEPLVQPAAGDVYVVDKGNNRVERFSSTGSPLGQFDGSGTFEVEGKVETGAVAPTGAFSAPEQVTVDNSGKTVVEDPSVGDVYVLDPGHDVIDKFSPTGEYLSQITPADACNPAQCKTEIEDATVRTEALTSMAVDPSGNLWVSDEIQEETRVNGQSVVDMIECGAAGSCVLKFKISIAQARRMAVDSSENVYTLAPDGIIEAFNSTTGQHIGEIVTFDLRPEVFSALAVSPSTNTLFGDGPGLEDNENGATSIAVYGIPGVLSGASKPIEQFPAEGLTGSFGVAVNASATVYATERGADRVESYDYLPLPTVTTETPSNVSETAMTLRGTVNPEDEPVSECYFEYGTEAGKYTNRAECEPPAGEGAGQIGKGAASVSVSAKVSGLEPADVRSVRLVAANANGTEPAAGVTISHPTTAGETLSNVGVIAASLSAQVDPGGLATKYRIEYGTSTAYGSNTPEESIGEGSEGVSVRVNLTGLQPGTQYHWRIVATNALGTIDGPDVAFATYASVAGLPDGRVYEPVSPVASDQDVNAYVPSTYFNFTQFFEQGIYANLELPFQAAAGGEAVVYAGDVPVSGGTGEEGAGKGNEYLSRHSPGGGWTQEAIESEANGHHDQYYAFTSDLSVGILEGPNAPATGAALGYPGLYTHATADGLGGGYDPLFTAVPDGEQQRIENASALYAGTNAGTAAVRPFSHLLFESNEGLLEGEGQLEKELGEDVEQKVEAKYSLFVHYLYDSAGGRPYLVDVLPNGRVAPGASFGAVRAGLVLNNKSGEGPGFTHVISADGSRVFWTDAPEDRLRALYVRENDTQPQSAVGPEEECLIPADACTVQVDAAVGGGGVFQGASADGSKVFFTKGDLYEYDLEGGETTDLSPGVTVQGVAGISDNGEYVYYVDSSDNIVLWHNGVTTRVAAAGAVSNDYSEESFATDYAGEIGSRTAEVTPDGHSLVFMSSQDLTGYDNQGIEEVFLYEAQSGKLTCVSCNPTGEAPVLTNATTVNDAEGIQQGEIGAQLPISVQATYQPRWISEDGSRVFFNSAQPLVPQATNGWLDVYEWERNGSGSCRQSQGCIYLLSSGSDPGNSYLLDASANGSDVFIITAAQLVAQDRNDLHDIYDVRVGGVLPGVTPACSGTGCQGVPPAPPIFATPASVTFDGVGNFPPGGQESNQKQVTKKTVKCKRGLVKNKKGQCVKKRPKKKTKAKKSVHINRRASR